MSQSAARRRRLALARTFPQATCSECGVSLARVDFPLKHLERCERLAADARAAEATLHLDPAPRPSLWRRLAVALGLATRGAVG